jgi:hypothetical protein
MRTLTKTERILLPKSLDLKNTKKRDDVPRKILKKTDRRTLKQFASQPLERNDKKLADEQHNDEEAGKNKESRQNKEEECPTGIRPLEKEVKTIVKGSKFQIKTCSKTLKIKVLTDYDVQDINENGEGSKLPKPQTFSERHGFR